MFPSLLPAASYACAAAALLLSWLCASCAVVSAHGAWPWPPPVRGGVALLVTAHPDDESMFFVPAIAALRFGGWLKPGCVVVTETARDEEPPALGEMLDQRRHGAALMSIFRLGEARG